MKNPKCQAPRISSDNLGTITVRANKRSVIANEAMKKCPGLCRDVLHIIHNTKNKFPPSSDGSVNCTLGQKI